MVFKYTKSNGLPWPPCCHGPRCGCGGHHKKILKLFSFKKSLINFYFLYLKSIFLQGITWLSVYIDQKI